MQELVKIPKGRLIHVIMVYFEMSYFCFQGTYFRQIEGTRIGNPASPAIANVVMHYILKRVVNRLSFQITFLFLYVDDTCLAVSEAQVDNLLTEFNAEHPKIQFTMEKEKNGQLSFLDVLLIRQNVGTLRTNWFTESTSSGRLLNYNSNQGCE